jgi:hypothetical protein
LAIARSATKPLAAAEETKHVPAPVIAYHLIWTGIVTGPFVERNRAIVPFTTDV